MLPKWWLKKGFGTYGSVFVTTWVWRMETVWFWTNEIHTKCEWFCCIKSHWPALNKYLPPELQKNHERISQFEPCTWKFEFKFVISVETPKTFFFHISFTGWSLLTSMASIFFAFYFLQNFFAKLVFFANKKQKKIKKKSATYIII